MNMGVVFGQMIVLFAMIVIGYLAYRFKWIEDKASKQISKLVVNVFNPALIINSVLGQGGMDGSRNILENLVFVFAYYILLILVSFFIPVILRTGKQLYYSYRLMAIFANIGFMGIPVVKSIFGDGAVIYVAFYILTYNILVYTYGVYLSQKAAYCKDEHASVQSLSWRESVKKMINPGVISAIAAIVIFAVQLHVPSPVAVFCDYVGNATVPLSMILIGVSVAQANIKEILGDWRSYGFILVRMLLFPICVVFLLRRMRLLEMVSDPAIWGIFIINLGMPVGSIVTLIAREYGADTNYCTKGIVLSTLASMVTIPFLCTFL